MILKLASACDNGLLTITADLRHKAIQLQLDFLQDDVELAYASKSWKKNPSPTSLVAQANHNKLTLQNFREHGIFC